MIEDFNGALTFDDIVDKYTIPQITIMRLDKPFVDYGDDDTTKINSAGDFLSYINSKK